MDRKYNIAGNRYGRLVVLYPVKGSKWHCKCDCGNEKDIVTRGLISGRIRSCGCWRYRYVAEKKSKHGMYKTKIYRTYSNMKRRCFDPNTQEYERYGGRGITVCEEWLGEHGFEHFKDWAYSNGYDESLTIDRIDNDGNYEPGNCRWADRFTQANNFSRNVKITFNGETHSLSEWGRIKPNGLGYDTLRSRLRDGWDIEKTFTTPKSTFEDDTGTMITVNGETHNVTHWCKLTGIDKCTFYRRLERGWSIERAATEKAHERHIMKRYRKNGNIQK